jgi:hypothetical protein
MCFIYFISFVNHQVSDYSNETPSSRESSTERRPLVGLVTNPQRKRVRSRSTSPILVGATGGGTIGNLLGPTSATVAAVTATLVAAKADEGSVGRTDGGATGLVVVTENGRRRRTANEDEDDEEEEEHMDDLDDDLDDDHHHHVKATMDEKHQQQQQQQQQREQMLLDVHRESLLSQALEGRSSQSLMAHLLAARRSGNQSETSSRSGHGHGGGGAGARNHHHHVEDDEASDSDNDTDASDRDRTDVGDLSNTEDNVYPSSGMGDHPHHHRSSSLHHHASEMMVPPSGYAAHHHPLLNLQSLHSLFPPGSMSGGNGPNGGSGSHHGRHQHDSHNNNNNNNDLAQATRRSLDLMRIRATDPRPCPQCGNYNFCCHHHFIFFTGETMSSSVAKMNCRENLPIRPHTADAFGRQAHSLSGLSMRFVRDSGQVAQFAALAHVATASRHQHQGPTSRPDARTIRSCFGFLPFGPGRRQR